MDTRTFKFFRTIVIDQKLLTEFKEALNSDQLKLT